ncbi:hypothetical protein SERLA73DRAFT_74855 [Serpula lacrymans var. lacrymans S7.3]|uniref:Nephrocystin 3-like N-terminal domain-containing protein n=2 Tax=Serpula lacrymans var. lacrymans TaxID=341189 RepID=F8Q1T9_SERL3|nr:uncharacterized protein SERLADRAFT_439524 [Serpula lacrymans var. lacrymans S7.9]EGN97150.1 hypothetical protein SERLA73DRAFT_74855 [Serpula lacrymans var. lacrymans S7.3]EGO22759.1 hypothetical protein SERLADRAFT_439524 [Serpula lacrymans var. lacrymans S7.9]
MTITVSLIWWRRLALSMLATAPSTKFTVSKSTSPEVSHTSTQSTKALGLTQLVTWLSPLNFRQTQNDIYANRQEWTCGWVFEEYKFKEWHQGNTKTLWCPGIPGSGKSVLASSMVKFLAEQHKTDGIAMSYIYCNYKDKARQAVSDLLANLLKQLVEGYISTFYSVKSSTTITNNISFSRVFVIVDVMDEVPEDGHVPYELLCRLNALGASLLVTSHDIAPIGDLLCDAQRMDI